MNSLQLKFNNLETELKETREEVNLLMAQAPRSFSAVLTGRTSREDVLTGSNLQEVGAGQGNMGEGSRRRDVGRSQEKEEELPRDVKREEKIENVCEKARRTIGLNQIYKEDIKRMYSKV